MVKKKKCNYLSKQLKYRFKEQKSIHFKTKYTFILNMKEQERLTEEKKSRIKKKKIKCSKVQNYSLKGQLK